jgi:dephospho-CoA kinase
MKAGAPQSSKCHGSNSVKLRGGLTGGIGSGKSEAARVLAALGALTIDADGLARLAVAPRSDGLMQIRASWPQVVRDDGTLDRAALAALVFEDPSERERLNAIVHPIVRRLAAELEATAAADQIVVHEVPLLFETGLAERCDATILIVAPRELRIARSEARSGFSREEIERRMAAQIDPGEARKRADFIIDNSGTLEDLRAGTERVYRALRDAPRTKP